MAEEKTGSGSQSKAEIAKELEREEGQGHTDWFDSLDSAGKDYITRMRNENIKFRQRKNEVQSELNSAKEKADEYDSLLKKQAEEQGKYKELYEKTAKELDEAKGLTERIKSLEGTFQMQLDEALKILPEKLQVIVKESGKPVEQQLVMASEIKAEITHEEDGVRSERPGGGLPLNTDEWEKLYRDKAKLLELHDSNKSLYDRIVKHMKGKK